MSACWYHNQVFLFASQNDRNLACRFCDVGFALGFQSDHFYTHHEEMPLLHGSKVFSCWTELLESEIWPEFFFLLISYFQFCKEVWVFSILLSPGIWLWESLPSYDIFLCIYSFMRIEFERLSLLFILLVLLFFILVLPSSGFSSSWFFGPLSGRLSSDFKEKFGTLFWLS